MTDDKKQYIFPELERKIFTKAGRILLPLELLIHGSAISISIENRNLEGVWLSIFFAVIFGLSHISNLRLRKYCLAKWSFDGMAFNVYIKDMNRTVEIDQPFCVSAMMLSFNRRYSSEKYPFIMIWKPGMSAPYEEMNGYSALEKRDALIIPYNDETLKIFRDELNISAIPMWPKSGVYAGIAEIKSVC